MSNPFSINNLLFPLTKGDTAGHPFHGNQFTAGQGGGAKDTADKIMDAVNKYGDENPNAQMNKGWQTVMEQAKMIGEHKMAIPKALVDSATKEDLDKLTDNNYHSARTAIEQQRPDLLTPSAREVNLGNYFKSESLLYPLTKGDTPGHPFHGNQYQAGQGGDVNLTPSGHRPLNEIAHDIEKVWNANSKNGVPYFAKPYLDAMKQLHDIKDNYYADSAKSIVNYLLANMGTFRGEGTAPLRAELKTLVK